MPRPYEQADHHTVPGGLSYQALVGAADELASILRDRLPVLPDGGMATMAGEVRRMETDLAVQLWRDATWTKVVGWVSRRVPDCDPIVPALHAFCHADQIRRCRADPAAVAAHVLAVARRSPVDAKRPSEIPGLDVDRVMAESPGHARDESLDPEAHRLLVAAGATPTEPAWRAISEGMDIAVDWWTEFARRTSLTGADLIGAARGDNAALHSGWRLRNNFAGPAGRPLVALLLGGDQWGRAARLASGEEPSLIVWALRRRWEETAGVLPAPVPDPIARGWRTVVILVNRGCSRPDEASAATRSWSAA